MLPFITAKANQHEAFPTEIISFWSQIFQRYFKNSIYFRVQIDDIKPRDNNLNLLIMIFWSCWQVVLKKKKKKGNIWNILNSCKDSNFEVDVWFLQ